jgi:hypothetical protein
VNICCCNEKERKTKMKKNEAGKTINLRGEKAFPDECLGSMEK